MLRGCGCLRGETLTLRRRLVMGVAPMGVPRMVVGDPAPPNTFRSLRYVTC